jgi:hypothetical protein
MQRTSDNWLPKLVIAPGFIFGVHLWLHDLEWHFERDRFSDVAALR